MNDVRRCAHDTSHEGHGRLRARGAIALLSLACLTGQGCMSLPRTTRIGSALPLSSGAPRGSCESTNWMQVYAVQGVGLAVDQGRYGSSVTSIEQSGHAVYAYGGDAETPMPVEEVLTRVAPRTELDRRMAPIRSIRRRELIGNWTIFGSSMVTLGGGVLLITTTDSIRDANPAAWTLIGLGVVGGIVGYIIRPSQYDRAWADLHEQVLGPPLDDMTLVNQGIDRFNHSLRAQCGNTSAPTQAPTSLPGAALNPAGS